MPKKQNTEADTNEIEHPIEIVHKLYDLTDERSDICTDRTWCFFNIIQRPLSLVKEG